MNLSPNLGQAEERLWDLSSKWALADRWKPYKTQEFLYWPRSDKAWSDFTEENVEEMLITGLLSAGNKLRALSEASV